MRHDNRFGRPLMTDHVPSSYTPNVAAQIVGCSPRHVRILRTLRLIEAEDDGKIPLREVVRIRGRGPVTGGDYLAALSSLEPAREKQRQYVRARRAAARSV